MGSRLNLQNELEKVLGNQNVYYQPPEGLQMNYPCIVYELSDIDIQHADNIPYINTRAYDLTLITEDQDTDVIDKLLSFSLIRFDRKFTMSGLYHFIFELFY